MARPQLINKVVPGPRVPGDRPFQVDYWLEEGQDGAIHLWCEGEGTHPRKIFTIYADGCGYVNKHTGIRPPGMEIDHAGRIAIKSYN